MIPKIIHYCWFGRNPKPKLAQKCLKSWKKYCKGYEIKEWNEDNFDISSAPLYVRQAYEAKKWAFVSDYVRLWAMVKYGGIYMDTDVEVVKPLDKFLENEAFSGFESETTISTGIMACRKDFPLFKELLHEYDSIPFVLEDGSLDIITNVTRITNCCKKYDFIPNGEYQVVNGFAIYPKEHFCPLSWNTKELHKTKNTYTIHWYSASWWDDQQKIEHKNRIKLRRKQERYYKRKNLIDWLKHIPNRMLIRILGKKRYEKLKKKMKG